MTDRPIPFIAPMVRALIEGRKTKTRRALKLPTKSPSGGAIYEHPKMGGWAPTSIGGDGCFTIGKNGERIQMPEKVGIWHQTCGNCIVAPYQPGDLLWVRETWGVCPSKIAGYENAVIRKHRADRVVYRADGGLFHRQQRWRPSIHMPRWASRLTLDVTDVMVERLRDINDADAIAEGLISVTEPVGDDWHRSELLYRGTPDLDWESDPIDAFAELWDFINGERPGCTWDDNPWICAVSFRCIRKNIDEVLRDQAS